MCSVCRANFERKSVLWSRMHFLLFVDLIDFDSLNIPIVLLSIRLVLPSNKSDSVVFRQRLSHWSFQGRWFSRAKNRHWIFALGLTRTNWFCSCRCERYMLSQMSTVEDIQLTVLLLWWSYSEVNINQIKYSRLIQVFHNNGQSLFSVHRFVFWRIIR